jgi:hypothetical protein
MLEYATRTMTRETVIFQDGKQAEVIRVLRNTPAKEIIEALGIPAPRGLICLNGGTAKLDERFQEQLKSLIADGLARVVAEELFTVITGGTDAGIFALFGYGIQSWHTRSPNVIGVAPEDRVKWPGGGKGDTSLEPHHTHFVLVEGKDWGDETATMYALAEEWSRACPSIAVFAGGGTITLNEMRANVQTGRQMILLAGSGRSTDAVLEARAGKGEPSEEVKEIAAKGKIEALDLRRDPQALATLVRSYLSGAKR